MNTYSRQLKDEVNTVTTNWVEVVRMEHVLFLG